MNLNQSQMADLKMNKKNQKILLKNKQKMQGRAMRSLTMVPPPTKNSHKILPMPTEINRAVTAGETTQRQTKLTTQPPMSKQQSSCSIISSAKLKCKKKNVVWAVLFFLV